MCNFEWRVYSRLHTSEYYLRYAKMSEVESVWHNGIVFTNMLVTLKYDLSCDDMPSQQYFLVGLSFTQCNKHFTWLHLIPGWDITCMTSWPDERGEGGLERQGNLQKSHGRRWSCAWWRVSIWFPISCLHSVLTVRHKRTSIQYQCVQRACTLWVDIVCTIHA